MRQFNIEKITLSGYRKFGKKSQKISVAYPDLVKNGSGLNIIVGSISSGKTSLLEIINWVCSGGLPDSDQMVINDGLKAGDVPKVLVDWVSIEVDGVKPIHYKVLSEFIVNGRRLSTNMVKKLPNSPDGSDYPNEANLIKFIRPNRTFVGTVSNEGPALQNAIDGEGRSESINLAGIISAIKNTPSPDDTLNFYKDKLKEYSRFGLDVEDIRIPFPQRGVAFADLEVRLKSGKWHNIQDISDGAKELMWWTWELFFGDINNYRIVCIDEIERSLHPQVQTAIMEMIWERSRHLQFFITTHSTYVANPHLKCKIHRISRNGIVYSVDSQDFEKPSIFTKDHNRIFFEDSVLFVEGINDLTYYSKKMIDYGFEELTHGVFFANSKDNIEEFAKICKKLGIKFHAIVDDDFTTKIHQLNSGNRRMLDRTLEALNTLSKLKGSVDADKLDEFIADPPAIKENRKSTIVLGKNYRKVAEYEIYPLRYGKLENYKKGFDRENKNVSSDQEDELKDIFSKIRKDRSRTK